MEVWNAARPEYPVLAAMGALTQKRSKLVFREKNITADEKEAIIRWTKDSTEIKLAMWGIGGSKKAQIYAAKLFALFDKYKSNINSDTRLYRGMCFTKEMFHKFNYDKIVKGEWHTPDKDAIVSFSSDKRKAFEYATMDSDKAYKVIYILEDEDRALDISKISVRPEEKESIITKGRVYFVSYAKVLKRETEIWKIIKLKNVK